MQLPSPTDMLLAFREHADAQLRLVIADWYEEHGQTEQAAHWRAECKVFQVGPGECYTPDEVLAVGARVITYYEIESQWEGTGASLIEFPDGSFEVVNLNHNSTNDGWDDFSGWDVNRRPLDWVIHHAGDPESIHSDSPLLACVAEYQKQTGQAHIRGSVT
jgi:uncharacterized protein (TIGR02996 family)